MTVQTPSHRFQAMTVGSGLDNRHQLRFRQRLPGDIQIMSNSFQIHLHPRAGGALMVQQVHAPTLALLPDFFKSKAEY